ncbi:MAG: hypothetical protein IPH45_19685 [Bacteroidales bacterium]|nr:hypothetical protein [Bacteroidales bacterium]
MPLYNELGITYREAGLKQEAIDIFLKGLKVEKDNVRIINELAITYRENKLYKEAIDRCKQSLCTDPQNKWAALNLLQIYLFFEPDKAKAIKYYEQSLQPPQITGFKNQKKSLHSIIENLDEILRLESDEIRFYEKYTYLAIQHKAYHSILPFLYKLNEKFPHSFKIISRLGKTLSNQVIARAEEGCVFLKEAISLFQQEQNEKEMQDHLVFYFNNLLFNEKLELLEEELQFYKQEIKFNYTYNLFRANYSIKQEKPEEEIINLFEEALETAELKAEKLKVIHALLKYLSTIEQKNYTDLVKKLITITAEIVKN